MDTFLLRICFALSTIISVVLSQSCEESHFQRCVEQLNRFTSKDDLIFALTEEDIKHQCVEAQASLGCINRFVRKCLSLEQRKYHLDFISGMEKLVVGFCSEDSDLRSRYIQGLPCYQAPNVSEGIRFCQQKFTRNQNDIAHVAYEDKIPLMCCSFDGFRRCLKMMMQLHEECLNGPIEVMDEIILRMTGVMGEGMCQEYFEKCTGGGVGHVVALISLTLLSIAVTSFLNIFLWSIPA